MVARARRATFWSLIKITYLVKLANNHTDWCVCVLSPFITGATGIDKWWRIGCRLSLCVMPFVFAPLIGHAIRQLVSREYVLYQLLCVASTIASTLSVAECCYLSFDVVSITFIRIANP